MAINSLPASTSLLTEIDKLAPGRRKTQDGTVGDTAHAQRVSDHNLDESGNTGASSDSDHVNEVHARDIDSRGPWPAGWSVERIVQTILARCRSGAEKRLKYVIYSGRIWEASNGWRQRTYTGADQHREHAHFSFRYGSGSGTANPENITTPWGILAAHTLEDDVALTDAEIVKIADTVWNRKFKSPYDNTDKFGYDFLRYATSRDTAAGAVMTQVKTELAGLKAAILTAVAADNVDEQALGAAIAEQVLAGLPDDRDDITPAELQTAIVGALRELATPQQG